MITKKLHIKSISEPEFVTNKQHEYSYAFRKLYKNIDKLDDKDYYNALKVDYNLNDIELRSIISEVKTKYNQIKTAKGKLESDILSITTELSYLKTQPQTKYTIRNIIKLTKKLTHKTNTLSRDIVFGGQVNLKKLGYLNNNKSVNKVKIQEVKQTYSENRLLPLSVLGEANQKGNRFFTFDLTNNKVTYKPCKGIKIEVIFSCYKNYKSDLEKLQYLINDKSISVSVRLSKDYLYLTYDDEKLNGFSLDTEARTKEVSLAKRQYTDKDDRKVIIKNIYQKYYRKQEESKLNNKLPYRYLAIDTNPDYIGCSIMDKVGNKISVVHTFNYDLIDLNKLENHKLNNKRRHGISHIWKDLFEVFRYYNCGYLVMEDLNLKGKDLGNVVANRKVNNLWYRELSGQLVEKYCNKLGIIRIEVNPCYSSFIGNLTYNYIDPVNASLEIGRRGIFKYIKNNFYPIMDVGTIMNAMILRNNVTQGDVSFIKDSSSWVELYREVRKSGLRYRATMNDYLGDYQVVNNLIHSNITKTCFSYEKYVSLLKLS